MTFPIPQIEVDGDAESITPTIRQQIVDRIKAALQTISRANGFQTNVGSSVHEWFSTSFNPATDLPALILRDLDEPIEEQTNNAFRHKRSLHIQVEVIAEGNTSPRVYRAIMGDIDQAIRSGYDSNEQEWWGGLAYKTRPRLSRMAVEQESHKIAGGVAEFFVDYASRAFDSYE